MSSTSLAQPAHPVPAPDLEHVGSILPRALPNLSPRLARGIALAQERFEEITWVAPWIWSVPSSSGGEVGAYTVDLKAGSCSCPDRVPEDECCKHEHAARYVKARTGTCSGCRRRFRHRELCPVGADNLTFFEGELLCGSCARSHGAL